MKLVFMGTPQFTVPVLNGLLAIPGTDIVGVYTPPDRGAGRGRQPEAPPVKRRALELGLPVFQPATLRSPEAQRVLAELRPDVVVVAAYGRLLPKPVLDLPPYGCLNLHPSLLPKHRGPSPVATAILEGDQVTGVTLMLLDEGMDTGPLIANREYPLRGDETAESLTGILFHSGAELLAESLQNWTSGNMTAVPQDGSKATVTTKLERADGLADWSRTAVELERRRRAFTPWPGLFTRWDGKVLKLLDVCVLPPEGVNSPPGTVVSIGSPDAPVGVATGDGLLGLRELQLESRRPVSAAEFLRGFPSFVGAAL